MSEQESIFKNNEQKTGTDTNEYLTLYPANWLYNAGLVGLVNIVNVNNIEINKYSLKMSTDLFENFAEKYFNYFFEKYNNTLVFDKLIQKQDYFQKIINNNYKDFDRKNLNKTIKMIKAKLKRNSYLSGYVIIDDNYEISKKIKAIKKIKKDDKPEDIKEKIKKLNELINYLKKENVKHILKAKDTIYSIINHYWGNISFLHQQKSKKNMYSLYEKEFIEPVIDYIDKSSKDGKYDCFMCDNKMQTKKETHNLAWLNNIGADANKKSSHFWDFNSDALICPLCKFVFSCIPAGFNSLNRRGIFINDNNDLRKLIKENKFSLTHENGEVKRISDLEQEGYYKIIEQLKQNEISKARLELENIQIIKYNGDNEQRAYSFNTISPRLLKIIQQNVKLFKTLVGKSVLIDEQNQNYINLYHRVINNLLEHKNNFRLIHNLLGLQIDKDYNRNISFEINIIIKINNNFLGGIMEETKVDNKKLYVLWQKGKELKNGYAERDAENKLGGISYRLLNALRVKNQSKFMDTVLDSYMYLNKEIPKLFIEGLENKTKFQTMGYSFLLGLQGEQYNNENKNKGE